jgi:hypothetical protein
MRTVIVMAAIVMAEAIRPGSTSETSLSLLFFTVFLAVADMMELRANIKRG